MTERRRGIAWAGTLAAAYLALAIVALWPLPTQLGSALSQGTDRAVTVPLFQAWSMWWTSERLAVGFAGLWDAPIFYPTPKSFLFSDPMLLEGIIAAPVFWAGGSPVLAYNLVLLLALVTNGLFGYGLLRSVALLRPVAAAGGAMLVMLPYVHPELGVLMLVSLAGDRSVVVVEHDMEFIRSIAKRVTVLHEGKVLAEGNMNAVQNDPRVIEVYLGELC